MVYAPGHYQRVTQPRRRGRRDRLVFTIGGLLSAMVIAVTLYSLTSREIRNGHGCLGFTYAMVMGGEQLHACGAEARHLCARPPQLGGLAHDFSVRLREACRAVGLPYRTGSA